ncbi:MAG TPA: ABC transporter permease [Solirubrobacterales bacterium]|nr:ABC transporter permease [Solirubrobacterales bacterium]
MNARWLLLKDLQILRRSPLQAVLLVAYPVLIAVLVGFAISRSPDKPRVAFLNEVPSDSRVSVGTTQLPRIGVSERICERVECVHVENRAEAVEEVRSGDVLAALILPADLVDRINSLSTPAPSTPQVEVIVNQEDPVKARLVNDRINSLLTQANLVIARRIAAEGGKFLGLVLNGGEFRVLGQTIEILGLRNTARILKQLRPTLPPGRMRDSVDEMIRFAGLASANLDTAEPLLTRLTQPIAVDKQVVNGSTPPLESFAIAVAATFTLAFVVVLLTAGSLALEREENAFPRLTRGLVSRSALLIEKIGLGVIVGFAVTLLMLFGLALFVPLHWSRFGLWVIAIAAGGAALAAAGGALGAAAREVRAVSLLAFMVTLPVAFLSLIPSGTVGPALYDGIQVITALFPFKPALRAMSGALDPAGPSVGIALAHLGALTVAYALLARFALRRFTSV